MLLLFFFKSTMPLNRIKSHIRKNHGQYVITTFEAGLDSYRLHTVISKILDIETPSIRGSVESNDCRLRNNAIKEVPGILFA